MQHWISNHTPNAMLRKLVNVQLGREEALLFREDYLIHLNENRRSIQRNINHSIYGPMLKAFKKSKNVTMDFEALRLKSGQTWVDDVVPIQFGMFINGSTYSTTIAHPQGLTPFEVGNVISREISDMENVNIWSISVSNLDEILLIKLFPNGYLILTKIAFKCNVYQYSKTPPTHLASCL